MSGDREAHFIARVVGIDRRLVVTCGRCDSDVEDTEAHVCPILVSADEYEGQP